MERDNSTKQKIQCLKEGKRYMEHWEWKSDILWYKDKKKIMSSIKVETKKY